MILLILLFDGLVSPNIGSKPATRFLYLPEPRQTMLIGSLAGLALSLPRWQRLWQPHRGRLGCNRLVLALLLGSALLLALACLWPPLCGLLLGGRLGLRWFLLAILLGSLPERRPATAAQ